LNGFKSSRIFYLLNKSAAAVILTSIVILALVAFFLKKDDMAHTSVTIGVMAFDSSRVHHILREYGEFIGRRGAGKISWSYQPEYDGAAGCDFILATSVQACRILEKGEGGCFLAAVDAEEGEFPEGLLVAARGARPSGVKTGRLAFSSPLSASCFFSPVQAAEEEIEGFSLGHADVEFTGCLVCVEELLYGVLFGKYFAAGIDRERFRMLISEGLMSETDFSVLARGRKVPDTVLLISKPISRRRLNRLRDILTGTYAGMPVSLKRDLSRMGVGGFSPCDSETLEEAARMLEDADYPERDYHP